MVGVGAYTYETYALAKEGIKPIQAEITRAPDIHSLKCAGWNCRTMLSALSLLPLACSCLRTPVAAAATTPLTQHKRVHSCIDSIPVPSAEISAG